MAKSPRFGFPILLGFIIGILFSYSAVLKPVPLREMEGSPLTAGLTGKRMTRDILSGVTTNVNEVSFKDNQFHGGKYYTHYRPLFVLLQKNTVGRQTTTQPHNMQTVNHRRKQRRKDH